MRLPPIALWSIMAVLLGSVGALQSWSVAFAILQLCLISSVVALGVNIQWGYAGLVNVGIVGFGALGGVAAMLTSVPAYGPAWSAGGGGIALAALTLVVIVSAIIFTLRRLVGFRQKLVLSVIAVAGFIVLRRIFDPAVMAIEATDAAKFGYLGGLGLPIVLGWAFGGLLAAAVAWMVGKITLGLRSDYLAIATLGISEIIVIVLKNEDWLTRGVKNVTALPRPVPAEINLQSSQWVIEWSALLGVSTVEFSSIFAKAMYCVLFALVLAVLIWLSERALRSPWGRMMRAIRDNRDAAEAMGKDVKARHLQVFILGSAICGIGGAMLTTLDGQFTPGTYAPLRYTFLIWVMVIVGGSGNNWGSVLGAFLIWFVWIEAEPAGLWLMSILTSGMPDGGALKARLLDSAPHLRLVLMGAILLSVLRFAPRGLIPER